MVSEWCTVSLLSDTLQSLMAIDVKNEGDKIIVTIDNGHREALARIVKDYNLIGEREALGFMLSIASDGKGKAIISNGEAYLPADDILKKHSANSDGEESN